MFSNLLTFILILIIATLAFSKRSHLDTFIHGNHGHTYLHNTINSSCFETTVAFASRRECNPTPERNAEACYECCDILCPKDDDCKHDMSGAPSCDSWH